MKFVLAAIGLVLGGLATGVFGSLSFGFLGLLLGMQLEQRAQLKALERKVQTLDQSMSSPSAPAPSALFSKPAAESKVVTPTAEKAPVVPSALPPLAPTAGAATPAATQTPAATVPAARQNTARAQYQPVQPRPAAQPRSPQPPNKLEQLIQQAWTFFTTGNVVVKIGMVVLFFGVAFLLKFAADNSVFPIEQRFIAIAVGAIGMLGVGWRLRNSKPHFSLPLQGGAIGILYITVFSAAKLYTLLPLSFTFVLMLVMVTFSGLLAVLQNSRALAVMATVGGFLAPILTSSGGGSHVALFSYFAVLNAGIFAIAWFKSWRILNWIGFIFTFAIGSAWGFDGYRPEHFASTQPFLILFFIFYVGVSVLYAHKQPPQLKGLVDGSLVFGVPLIGFTLQSLLVKDFEFGLAFSALVMSLVYLTLARWLWNKQIPGMRLLTECFLALGVLFATLCVPFVLDGDWTGATWALEGAGLIWVGLRQQRLLPRIAGCALTLIAGVVFLAEHLFNSQSSTAFISDAVLGCSLIALGGFFASLQYCLHQSQVKKFERLNAALLLAWAMLWWLLGWYIEIAMQLTVIYQSSVAIAFTAASIAVLIFIAKRYAWTTAYYTVAVLLAILWLFAAAIGSNYQLLHPFAHGGWMSWLFAFAIFYVLFKKVATDLPTLLTHCLHTLSLWFSLYIVVWGLSGSIVTLSTDLYPWAAMLWGLVPVAVLFAVPRLATRLAWPLQHHSYARFALPGIALYSAVWLLNSCTHFVDPHPLPYLPILNPLDLAQLLVLFVLGDWVWNYKPHANDSQLPLRKVHLYGAFAALSFIWLNSVLAHAVANYANIYFAFDPLFNSGIYQSAVSILWTLTALGGMALAKKIVQRNLWLISAGLLGVVVVKLFLLDLGESGTVARIISFMTVGGLMLAIGYIAPLPPKSSASDENSAPEPKANGTENPPHASAINQPASPPQ